MPSKDEIWTKLREEAEKDPELRGRGVQVSSDAVVLVVMWLWVVAKRLFPLVVKHYKLRQTRGPDGKLKLEKKRICWDDVQKAIADFDGLPESFLLSDKEGD